MLKNIIHNHFISLVVIFLIAFFLRFYALGEIPNGLYQDETAIGYNAYSILATGKDEYGVNHPLYFKSFGDYKLPVYVYLSSLSIAAFGPTSFAVRLPSALFGVLSVLLFYTLLRALSKNKTLSLVAMFLLAINPWHIHYSRATFEVSIALFFFLLGTYCIYKYFSERLRGGLLVGTVCFIVALYSYNLTRLLSPLLYAFIFFVCYKTKKSSGNKSENILTVIVSILLLFPFLSSILQNGGVASSSGTLLFSSMAVKSPLLELRSYILSVSPFYAKLLFNMPFQLLFQYVQNIASYLSVQFLFLTGSLHGNHGIGNVGQLYVFELPLVLMGIYSLVKLKRSWCILVFGWTVLTVAVAALTREAPHATRSFFLIVPLEIYSATGLMWLVSQLSNAKYKIANIALIMGFVIFSAYNVIYYFTTYYIRFPIFYAKQWRFADKPLSEFIKQHESQYSKIIFDNEAGFMYTSLLFYNQISPIEFQGTVKRTVDDSEGFSQVQSFSKYEFKEVDWTNDYNQKNVLIITTPDRKPLFAPPLITFYYPKRPVVFSIKEVLNNYPIEEIAYVLVESKK